VGILVEFTEHKYELRESREFREQVTVVSDGNGVERIMTGVDKEDALGIFNTFMIL
jgi:hypothetical protein